MYPLHCNYVTTLPCKCKRITMKITIFIIVLVLKSNENIKIWHFRLSQLANSSKACENRLFIHVFKVSAPSFHKSSKSFWLSMALLMEFCGRSSHCLQDFLQLVDGIWLTTGCGNIAYSPVGYFILSHPVHLHYETDKELRCSSQI